MICYQVFLELDASLDEQEWRHYMINEHIPDVMNTNCFLKCNMLKDDNQPRTWQIQYFLDDASKLDIYQKDFAPALKQEVIDRYPNKFKAERTITKLIHTF